MIMRTTHGCTAGAFRVRYSLGVRVRTTVGTVGHLQRRDHLTELYNFRPELTKVGGEGNNVHEEKCWGGLCHHLVGMGSEGLQGYVPGRGQNHADVAVEVLE